MVGIQKKLPNIYEQIEKASGEQELQIYKHLEFLGQGSFGLVNKFICTETSIEYAVKRIKKETLCEPNLREKLMKEIKIHRKLKHKNIVQFDHFFEDEQHVYIFLELCKSETMNHLLNVRKKLPEIEVKYFIKQISEGLKYLRVKKILHRDLKLQNLLLSERMEVKIADFGLAENLETEKERLFEICGTPNYMAPEILNSKEGYSFEADIWSLGVIMYALLVGELPFQSESEELISNKIKNKRYYYPEEVKISEKAKDLISKLLEADPKKRISLFDIQLHPFFEQEVLEIIPFSILEINEHISFRNIGVENRSFYEPEEVSMVKWLDRSDEYGIGALLSNGTITVYFKDKTKFVSSLSSERFIYVGRGRVRESPPLEYFWREYPEFLSKKVRLLNFFMKYFSCNRIEETSGIINYPYEPCVYIKKWRKTEDCFVFTLSNKTIQGIFKDATSIFLSSKNKTAKFIDQEGNSVVENIDIAYRNSSSGYFHKFHTVFKTTLDSHYFEGLN